MATVCAPQKRKEQCPRWTHPTSPCQRGPSHLQTTTPKEMDQQPGKKYPAIHPRTNRYPHHGGGCDDQQRAVGRGNPHPPRHVPQGLRLSNPQAWQYTHTHRLTYSHTPICQSYEVIPILTAPSHEVLASSLQINIILATFNACGINLYSGSSHSPKTGN